MGFPVEGILSLYPQWTLTINYPRQRLSYLPPHHNTKRSTNQPKVIQYNMSTAEGCYLSFHADSGGRLELQYSKTSVEKGMYHSDFHIHPTNCLTLQRSLQQSRFGKLEKERRYKVSSSIKNSGRQELIKGIAGGDANKKKYYSGCCQYMKV